VEKIAQHSLPMSLVGAEYTFDGQKLIFYFTAENRVDFRELVRDLAATFKTRIELRQIGVRDEAKMLGGLGPCGRPICCATFLGEFQPVSIRMAKEQNLSLNPTKISGLCGRLMCCLRYECEHYAEPRPTLPEIGATVLTPEAEFPAEQVTALDGRPRQANGAAGDHPCGRQQPADRPGRDRPERDE
jgi:cell fate regulator YaaT (PSP1 superfamily)